MPALGDPLLEQKYQVLWKPLPLAQHTYIGRALSNLESVHLRTRIEALACVTQEECPHYIYTLKKEADLVKLVQSFKAACHAAHKMLGKYSCTVHANKDAA